MNKTKIKVRHADSFLEQLSDRFDRIRRRAFELFERRGAGSPDLALEDWLAAERELALQPPVELSETEEGFEVEAALPGMDPDDVVVEATNEDVLISAERKSRHKDNAHGKTETMVRMFRTIHFPTRIDPEHVKADFREGLLTVRAARAEAESSARVAVGA